MNNCGNRREQILAWVCNRPSKSDLLGEDKFVSIVEKNGVQGFLYHPTMETVQSLIKYDEDDSKKGVFSVSDLYETGHFDENSVFLPQFRENKDKRDTWYKYDITSADVTRRKDGLTPLSLACYYGRPQIVLLLLSLLDHPVNVTTTDGSTPVMETIASLKSSEDERLQCLEHLVKYGASGTDLHESGHSAVTISCYNGTESILKALDTSYSSSLDWNHQTELGHTPLMFAVYSENLKTIRYLLNQKQVDAMKENKEHLTAFDLSLLLDCDSQIKGLLALYMAYNNQLRIYVQTRVITLYKITQKNEFGLKEEQQTLLFMCCLLAICFLSKFRPARKIILEAGVLDFILDNTMWKDTPDVIKSELCLNLAAHLFYDGDEVGMAKLMATSWAHQQFQIEENNIDQSTEYSLDRFMGIVSFFMIAQGGNDWIFARFMEYPKLALKIAKFDPGHKTFVTGFYNEVIKILKEYNIEDGFELFSKHSKGKYKKLQENDEQLKKRIQGLVSSRNHTILQLQKNKKKLESLARDNTRILPSCQKKDIVEVSFIKKMLKNESEHQQTKLEQNESSELNKEEEDLKNENEVDDGDFIEVTRERKKSVAESECSGETLSRKQRRKLKKENRKSLVNKESGNRKQDVKQKIQVKQDTVNLTSSTQEKTAGKDKNDDKSLRKSKHSLEEKNNTSPQNKETILTPSRASDFTKQHCKQNKADGKASCHFNNELKKNTTTATILPPKQNPWVKVITPSYPNKVPVDQQIAKWANHPFKENKQDDNSTNTPGKQENAPSNDKIKSEIKDKDTLKQNINKTDFTNQNFPDFPSPNIVKLNEKINVEEKANIVKATTTSISFASMEEVKLENNVVSPMLYSNGSKQNCSHEPQIPDNLLSIQSVPPGFQPHNWQCLSQQMARNNHMLQPFAGNYFDPAILSFAQQFVPSHDINEFDSKQKTNAQSPCLDNSVHFPSASHDIIPSYLKAMLQRPKSSESLKTKENMQSQAGANANNLQQNVASNSENRSIPKKAGSTDESGYLSPAQQVEEKMPAQLMFVKNWQKKSRRWHKHLQRLIKASKTDILKVGSINFLAQDDKVISKGSCGTVVRVGIRDDGSEVAIKCMVKCYTGLIKNELHSLRELHHKNIVHYYDYVEDPNFAYVALELCEYTLDEYISILKKTNSLTKNTRRLSCQMMNGLKALHDAKLLHMDLKPRNVLVDIKGDLRLADFGLSHRLNDEQNTFYHDKVHGTKCWRAPETISVPYGTGENSGRYKQSTDIYVAGMILYFILTGGHHPFGDDPARCEMNILNGCPPNISILKDEIFVDLFLVMMDPDMNRRISVDECLQHPFFWDDHRRFEFLVSVGHDQEVAGRVSNKLITAVEASLMMKSSCAQWMHTMDKEFSEYMGWNYLNLNNVLDILTVVFPEVDDRWNEITLQFGNRLGEPDSYLLSCFPGLFMSVYEAVCNVGWKRRHGLREYFKN